MDDINQINAVFGLRYAQSELDRIESDPNSSLDDIYAACDARDWHEANVNGTLKGY